MGGDADRTIYSGSLMDELAHRDTVLEELRHVSRVTGEPLPKLVRELRALDAEARRARLIANGYKTDSRCKWLAIGRCAECGREHDGVTGEQP